MKKYKVIVKTDTREFVKYNVNDLLLFTSFLDEKWSGWRWFNVYEYTKEGTGKQVANFTNRSRPSGKYVQDCR